MSVLGVTDVHFSICSFHWFKAKLEKQKMIVDFLIAAITLIPIPTSEKELLCKVTYQGLSGAARENQYSRVSLGLVPEYTTDSEALIRSEGCIFSVSDVYRRHRSVIGVIHLIYQ